MAQRRSSVQHMSAAVSGHYELVVVDVEINMLRSTQ